MYVQPLAEVDDLLDVLSSPSSAFSAEPITNGMSSPGKSYSLRRSRTSTSTSSSSSSSSTRSALLRNTTMYGTPTWRASRCARARGHRAVRRRDHEDRAVHLGGARDHVFDVVRVARAVDVGVVAVLRLVLDVGGRDRDAAGLLLGSVVDLLEGAGLPAVLLGQHLGDGRGQRGLAVVDVTDGADVDVRLVPSRTSPSPLSLALLSL